MATEGSREETASVLGEIQGRVAERVEDLRGWAEAADAAIRRFAREKPLLALACAAGAGFLIGRLASRT